MAFQLSPGVNFSEIDLTNATAAVATTEGALAGVFRWGPINERKLITSETQLVEVFGKPASVYKGDNNTNFWTNAETFYTAANFLGYSDALYVTRVVETLDTEGGAAAKAKNNTQKFEAKYYGDLGNSLEISYCKGNADGVRAFSGIDAINDYTSASVLGTQGSTTIKIEGLEDSADALAIQPGDVLAVKTSSLDPLQDLTVVSTSTTSGSVQGEIDQTFGASTATTGLVSSLDATTASVFTALTGADKLGADATFTVDVSSASASGTGASIIFTYIETTGLFTGALGAKGSGYAEDEVLTITQVDLAAAFGVATTTDDAGNANDFTVTVDEIESDHLTAGVIPHTTPAQGSEHLLALSSIIVLSSDISIKAGNPVVFASGIADSLPTGIDNGTVYYAIPVNSTTTDTDNVGDVLRVNDTAQERQLQTTNAIKLATSYVDAITYDDDTTSTLALAVQFTAAVDSSNNVEFKHYDQSSAEIVVKEKFAGLTGSYAFNKHWGQYDLFDTAPSSANSYHIVVSDRDGEISGVPGTILETFADVSSLEGVRNTDGTSNFVGDVLEASSNYITVTDPTALPDSFNSSVLLTDTAGSDGNDEANISLGDIAVGYDTFKDGGEVDVSFILQGKPLGDNGYELSNYIIDNIAETRKDCVAFVSPPLTNNTAQTIVDWAANVTASSYAVVDSGYKYQYDKYSDVYRFIPLNGDIAGLCARTDDARDPWFSPAGYNRGNVKNVVKLNFNPNKSQRDLLYKSGVNPVITQAGQGTVLFGDKTYSGVTSAFDRINVRRLFIVLEKTIARAAKSTLFEFNDEFTRANFRNLVEPFLRDVQGRRGIYDFKVICDETNNTGQVIDTNSFVGDIYIKPARSINFIQLNFVAVRTGVEFSEVVGAA